MRFTNMVKYILCYIICTASYLFGSIYAQGNQKIAFDTVHHKWSIDQNTISDKELKNYILQNYPQALPTYKKINRKKSLSKILKVTGGIFTAVGSYYLLSKKGNINVGHQIGSVITVSSGLPLMVLGAATQPKTSDYQDLYLKIK